MIRVLSSCVTEVIDHYSQRKQCPTGVISRASPIPWFLLTYLQTYTEENCANLTNTCQSGTSFPMEE